MWEDSVFIMAIHVRANSEVWLICRSRWIQIQVSYVAIMIILDHTRQVKNAKFFFCVAVAMHLKLFSAVSRVKTSLYPKMNLKIDSDTLE